jgi:hypothetical protein
MRVTLKILSVTTFFIVYVIALSFIPLAHQTFVAQSSWLGYGTGAYAFQSPNYFVLFNDPYDGSSKPNIHVNPTFAPNERISLVEFSDWTSYVNGFNLFNDFNVTMNISKTSWSRLEATYTRPGLVVHKFVDISAAGQVIVGLQASKEMVAHIEMWKWLMTSIDGFTIQNTPKPKLIPITQMVNFTFKDQTFLASGDGSIELSRVPSQIEVWPFEGGFNRVTVDFINSEMTFTVSGTTANTQQKLPIWSYTELPYVLPIIAITVASLFLLVEHYGKKSKDHTRRSRS